MSERGPTAGEFAEYLRQQELTALRIENAKLKAEHDQIFALLPATTNGDSDNVGGVRALSERVAQLEEAIREGLRQVADARNNPDTNRYLVAAEDALLGALK